MIRLSCQVGLYAAGYNGEDHLLALLISLFELDPPHLYLWHFDGSTHIVEYVSFDNRLRKQARILFDHFVYELAELLPVTDDLSIVLKFDW